MLDNYAKLLLRFVDPDFLGTLPLSVMGVRFDNAEFQCTIIRGIRVELPHYISLFFVALHFITISTLLGLDFLGILRVVILYDLVTADCINMTSMPECTCIPGDRRKFTSIYILPIQFLE